MGRGATYLKSFFFFFVVIVAGTATRSPAFTADFYTEQSYLGREQVIVNSLRVRASQEVLPGLTPYLQAGQELMTAGNGQLSLDTGSSYAYAGPGLRYRAGPLQLFSELRARAWYTYRPQPMNLQHTLDLRGLAVYGAFFSRRVSEGSRFHLFGEPYVELLYTSADFNNVVLAGFLRGGLRWQALEKLSVDLYVEPFATVDRVRHYYNNRVDVKPSLRVHYGTASFQASLLVSYLFNEYFTRGDFDPNPYRDRASGARFLAVVGGSF